MVNWIALMGWSLDDRTEFFTLADLVRSFSLAAAQPVARGDQLHEARPLNGLHIRALPPEELERRLRPFLEKAGLAVDEARLLAVAPLVRERLVTLDDAVAMTGFFFRDDVAPVATTLVAKGLTVAQSAAAAARPLALLEGLDSVAHRPPSRPCARSSRELF